MAHGGDFIVPPGFPNDTFTVHVSSGERVTVQTALQQKATTGAIRDAGTGDVIIQQYYQTREAAAMGNALITMLENQRLNSAMGG